MAKEFLQKESSGPNDWTVWSVSGRIDMVTADSAYATGEDLRVLLRLNKLAKKNGKTFTLARPSGIVKSVLEDSGMDALFTIYTSLEELD